MVKTLEDLKAENAAAELSAETAPQVVDEIDEVEAVIEEEAGSSDVAEHDESEATEPVIESWMETEEASDADSKKFTDGDIGKAKAKLKAKIERKDGEIERLQEENKQLRAGGVPSGEALKRPARDEFDESADPEEAYLDALTDWKIATNESKRSATKTANQTAIQQNELRQKVESKVNEHYERAAVLSEKSGIAPELYQRADGELRLAIDSATNGNGDVYTDGLIASLGEGSEKVMYSIGINAGKRAHLAELFREDKSGIKAAMYLGGLKSEINGAAQRKKTSAPAPAKHAAGDSNVSSSEGALVKRYKKANSSGDAQEAFNVKQEARRAKINTKNW